MFCPYYFKNNPGSADLPGQVRDALCRRLLQHLLATALVAAGILCGTAQVEAAQATSGSAQAPKPAESATQPQDLRKIYIQEYRVEGSHRLPRIDVETAVYPYLGPGRTADDVEHARSALEKAFRDKGFQTVSVVIPEQDPSAGVVILQVQEGKVGRLRVRGSRYFSLDQIKKQAPSLAEGKVMDFNNVQKDLVALNQSADRQVTPALHIGDQPGTVDIDLNVKDTPPLHGSLELNNRYSFNTSEFRVNGSINYDNLWQLGQTIGASFQVAPENASQVTVFSGYYTAPVPGVSWLSLMLQGTKQDSDVSTLPPGDNQSGGGDSVGRGAIIGTRAIISLPSSEVFYHSLSLGLDYKNLTQQTDTVIATGSQNPTTYFPFSASYSASWVPKDKSHLTELNAAVNFSIRAMGASENEFENNHHDADPGYIYFRGDIAHTHDLPGGFQVFGKVQGQAADEPLLTSEQFSLGGLDTVRGYLESEEMGDAAVCGSFEFRSPSLSTWLGAPVNDWRFYFFCDAGQVDINNPLPDQQNCYSLASFGVGSRIKVRDHFNGSFDLGVPMIGVTELNPSGHGVLTETSVHSLLFTFRLFAEF